MKKLERIGHVVSSNFSHRSRLWGRNRWGRLFPSFIYTSTTVSKLLRVGTWNPSKKIRPIFDLIWLIFEKNANRSKNRIWVDNIGKIAKFDKHNWMVKIGSVCILNRFIGWFFEKSVIFFKVCHAASGVLSRNWQVGIAPSRGPPTSTNTLPPCYHLCHLSPLAGAALTLKDLWT